jgi:hypothetical protein
VEIFIFSTYAYTVLRLCVSLRLMCICAFLKSYSCKANKTVDTVHMARLYFLYYAKYHGEMFQVKVLYTKISLVRTNWGRGRPK